jgi:hypothetical protein
MTPLEWFIFVLSPGLSGLLALWLSLYGGRENDGSAFVEFF